jgi:hypothetical protein
VIPAAETANSGEPWKAETDRSKIACQPRINALLFRNLKHCAMEQKLRLNLCSFCEVERKTS